MVEIRPWSHPGGLWALTACCDQAVKDLGSVRRSAGESLAAAAFLK